MSQTVTVTSTSTSAVADTGSGAFTGTGPRGAAWNRARQRGASGLRQGRPPAGRSSPSPGILAVRSTLRAQW
jgi:hypothetical protein